MIYCWLTFSQVELGACGGISLRVFITNKGYLVTSKPLSPLNQIKWDRLHALRSLAGSSFVHHLHVLFVFSTKIASRLTTSNLRWKLAMLTSMIARYWLYAYLLSHSDSCLSRYQDIFDHFLYSQYNSCLGISVSLITKTVSDDLHFANSAGWFFLPSYLPPLSLYSLHSSPRRLLFWVSVSSSSPWMQWC